MYRKKSNITKVFPKIFVISPPWLYMYKNNKYNLVAVKNYFP